MKFSKSCDHAAHLTVQSGTVYSSAVDDCHTPESRASSNVGFGLQTL